MHRDPARFFRFASTARIGMAIAIGVASLTPREAGASEDLARTKGCFSCHSVQAKVVGPAYKDVAAKYAGQADAEDKLVLKVLNGSQGTWGFIPMPPNTNVNADEARALVKWILANP